MYVLDVHRDVLMTSHCFYFSLTTYFASVVCDVTYTTYIAGDPPCHHLFNANMQISIDPHKEIAPTRDLSPLTNTAARNLPAKAVKVHPSKPGENASIFFVGTATTVMFVTILSTKRQALIATANGLELD
jgi:hypothetical protein